MKAVCGQMTHTVSLSCTGLSGTTTSLQRGGLRGACRTREAAARCMGALRVIPVLTADRPGARGSAGETGNTRKVTGHGVIVVGTTRPEGEVVCMLWAGEGGWAGGAGVLAYM